MTDFEYELQIAQLNRNLDPKLDTVFLVTSVQYAYLSSSSVRELASYQGNISSLVPEELVSMIEEKYKNIKK